MPGPSQHAIGQLLTHLLGRRVTVALGAAAKEAKARQICGLYTIMPEGGKIFVKAEVPLLCDFAAVLLGLPAADVQKRVAAAPVDATVQDAIREVFNVFSAAITFHGRTVFQEMVRDATLLASIDTEIKRLKMSAYFFDISLNNYEGGKIAIYL